MDIQEDQSPLRQKPTRRVFFKGLIILGAGIGVGASGATLWWMTHPRSYPLYTFHEEAFALSWSPNGQQLASITKDGAFRVWNTSNYTSTHAGLGRENLVLGFVSWSPNGQYLAVSFGKDTIQIWKVADWSSFAICSTNSGIVSSLAWSPDSKRIALGTLDKKVYVFQPGETLPQKPVYIYALHEDEVSVLAWSPDGIRIASGSYDGTVRIWDASNEATLLIYSGHAKHIINALVWSPDSQFIVSAPGPREGGVQPDHAVQVWRATTGEQMYRYSGHQDYVHSLAWEPHGKRIASASEDKTVQIWSPQSNTAVYTYQGHTAGVYSVVWRPNALQLASAANDAIVQIWQPT